MTPSRWRDYFVEEDFGRFWAKRAEDPSVRVLIVLGVGFDPRCLVTLRTIAGSAGLGDRLGYLALRLIARPALGDTGVVTERLSKANFDELAGIVGGRAEAVYDIETHDSEGHNVAGRKTLDAISNASSVLAAYTDVIVDISGMPRGVFFPLLAYLLRLAEKEIFTNLHVAVVEDPVLDDRMSGREYGQADFLHTFRLQGDNKLVWLPVLGSSEVARLEKIHNRLKGACIEICPVLPFPARSLRRVDDIVMKHSELLFEGFLVSPENLLLCDERTPFDVYRKVLDVEGYYRQRLGAISGIGAVTTVVSPLASKTLSLGVLLAAVERSLPVCHVEAGTYHVDVDDDGRLVGDTTRGPTDIWLAGEPYAP
jgi:hypothetical protein